MRNISSAVPRDVAALLWHQFLVQRVLIHVLGRLKVWPCTVAKFLHRRPGYRDCFPTLYPCLFPTIPLSFSHVPPCRLHRSASSYFAHSAAGVSVFHATVALLSLENSAQVSRMSLRGAREPVQGFMERVI